MNTPKVLHQIAMETSRMSLESEYVLESIKLGKSEHRINRPDFEFYTQRKEELLNPGTKKKIGWKSFVTHRVIMPLRFKMDPKEYLSAAEQSVAEDKPKYTPRTDSLVERRRTLESMYAFQGRVSSVENESDKFGGNENNTSRSPSKTGYSKDNALSDIYGMNFRKSSTSPSHNPISKRPRSRTLSDDKNKVLRDTRNSSITTQLSSFDRPCSSNSSSSAFRTSLESFAGSSSSKKNSRTEREKSALSNYGRSFSKSPPRTDRRSRSSYGQKRKARRSKKQIAEDLNRKFEEEHILTFRPAWLNANTSLEVQQFYDPYTNVM
jgi:hypothetical protein